MLQMFTVCLGDVSDTGKYVLRENLQATYVNVHIGTDIVQIGKFTNGRALTRQN